MMVKLNLSMLFSWLPEILVGNISHILLRLLELYQAVVSLLKGKRTHATMSHALIAFNTAIWLCHGKTTPLIYD